MRESEEMIDHIKQVVLDTINRMDNLSIYKKHDWTLKKTSIKDAIHNYVYEQTKRNPMILPIVMEIDPTLMPVQQENLDLADDEQ